MPGTGVLSPRGLRHQDTKDQLDKNQVDFWKVLILGSSCERQFSGWGLLSLLSIYQWQHEIWGEREADLGASPVELSSPQKPAKLPWLPRHPHDSPFSISPSGDTPHFPAHSEKHPSAASGPWATMSLGKARFTLTEFL